MFVPSENVWLNSLLETWIGKDRAAGANGTTGKIAVIFDDFLSIGRCSTA